MRKNYIAKVSLQNFDGTTEERAGFETDSLMDFSEWLVKGIEFFKGELNYSPNREGACFTITVNTGSDIREIAISRNIYTDEVFVSEN